MTTTMGIKMDDALKERVRQAAQGLERTPHWLVKQAVLQYVEALERGEKTIQLMPFTHNEAVGVTGSEGLVQPEAQPFLEFAQGVQPQTHLRAAITAAWNRPEPECLPFLLPLARTEDAQQAEQVQQLASRLVQGLRDAPVASGVAALVQEFSLSSQEGIALMCLAEALLRIPDSATRDALIRDKISKGDWRSHVGQSPSMFVNAAAWGLVITGKLTSTNSEKGLSNALTRVISKGGEPLIRQGVNRAMKLMGEQFVTGQNIGEALANSRAYEKKGFRYSYDMLGEAAATAQDALRYLRDYEQAIHAIGAASAGRGIFAGPGISIKLSALHPRYSRAQYQRVMEELLPRVLHLAELCRSYDIGMNIDAEEADRLELSLDLLEALSAAPSLRGWNGIGFVVQAYQKRCPYVIDYLIDLARRSRRRLMVRLVKGAYWDSEVKRAQLDGMPGYPVYTRKVFTDVSYLACARKLLSAPEQIYPQFATHNAQTLSAIYNMAGQDYYEGKYEFQCLHGMGEPLYEQVTGSESEGKLARPCRIYAPVGSHETLLAYLVRRLLENGANTSFVNRIGDASVPVAELVQDPVQQVEQMAQQEGVLGAPNPKIALPADILSVGAAPARRNSQGFNVAHEQQLASLAAALLHSTRTVYRAQATGASAATDDAGWQAVLNPADTRDVVGYVYPATDQQVQVAMANARAAVPVWSGTPPERRADMLARAADLLEQRSQTVLGLIMREAGKTLSNAVAEIRETVDFLRYYGAQVAAEFDNAPHRPLGVVTAISPWNFPLAIFSGQVAAALAAGNVVLAKPAEQTPLVAALMVDFLHEAGVPQHALQLLPGDGVQVGTPLVAHAGTDGVMFTGSTEVAQVIARTLSGRLSDAGQPIPLIAETGGQNAMIVDSSALAEQVVGDVLSSAFDSAGQRCSALRVLCVQEDVADRTITMLKHAAQEWNIGNPDRLDTDVGPVIDAQAQEVIEAHIERMQQEGQQVTRVSRNEPTTPGHFVVPAVVEIDKLSRLQREVFGPVLHVLRFQRDELDQLVDAINATGYGLTFCVHSRIDETIERVTSRIHAGNLYVNRNQIGAVVGVQPFGGMGLSGTGPKAGGPLYLYRLVRTQDPQADLARLPAQEQAAMPDALQALRQLVVQGSVPDLGTTAQAAALKACDAPSHYPSSGYMQTLPGPTGESNRYQLLARAGVWLVPSTVNGLVQQVAAALGTGNTATVVCSAALRPALAALQAVPALASALQVVEADALRDEQLAMSVLLHEGDSDALLLLAQQVAQRNGQLVRVESRTAEQLLQEHSYNLSALVHEQSMSTNTAAAGGNAQLMTTA